MRVRVTSVLFEYTGDRNVVEASGSTLGAVLKDLDRRYPGLRFRVVDEQDRIRPHMNVFIAERRTRDLAARVGPDDEVCILHALSGG